ncbi:MAG: MFS transporter, partial [Myxococcales bacterium]|nr:MFS transporter [Myxococcales bacterium]
MSDTSRTDRALWLTVVLLIGVSVWLRTTDLGRLPGINGDEAWYGVQAERWLSGDPVWQTASGNPLNPFHTGPVAVLQLVFEPAFWILRAPSWMAGVALVPLLFFLLRPVLGATVANRWFVARRGLALGILNSSNSTGQLIFLPLLMALIVSAGWRGSVMLLVTSALILMPIIAFLMRDDPAEVGLKPLGLEQGAGSATGQQGRNPNADQLVRATSISEAVKNPTFWLLCGCFFICGATSAGLVGTHLIPHAI